jgi:hypothetical protein
LVVAANVARFWNYARIAVDYFPLLSTEETSQLPDDEESQTKI